MSSALANGLTNSHLDTSRLVNDLYTSIVNYEAVHRYTSQSAQGVQEKSDFWSASYHTYQSRYRR